MNDKMQELSIRFQWFIAIIILKSTKRHTPLIY